MVELFKRLFKGDRVIWIVFFLLCLYSLVFVYSATSTIAYKSASIISPIVRHAAFLGAGLVGILVFHNIPYGKFKWLGIAFPFVFILLLITLKWGVEINGERRWLEIFGIQFQPSEIAKLSLISFIALLLSKRDILTDKQIFWTILTGAGLICGAIFPTNGSTALLLFGFTIIMMTIGQVSFKRISKLCISLGAALMLFVMFLKFAPDSLVNSRFFPDRFVTWKSRIEKFSSDEPMVEENGKIKDEYFQVVHSQIAIAKGGFFGKGPGYGDQRDVLPQAFSDFIYSIILEEGGLILGVFLLFLYLVLLVRVGMIANKCKSLFPKFLVIGCGLLLGLQAIINLAVAVHLIPVTGQPLPLISRGGTSTVISCVYIGIILSVSRFAANMGNEVDDFPEEEKKDEENVLPITISEEDVANWVPDVSDDNLAKQRN